MSITSSTLYQLFESFVDVKAIIVGDAMLDHYIFGGINRVSPEAPISIVDVDDREDRLGGAANVAYNMHRMGAYSILATVVGDDEAGSVISELLRHNEMDASGVIMGPARQTTVKNRIYSQNRQIVRFDEETVKPIDEQLELTFINMVENLIEQHQPNVVVLQDYNKGTLTPNVISSVIEICNNNNINVAVDPKFENFKAYKGCTLFKPNLVETEKGLNTKIVTDNHHSLKEAAEEIERQLENKYTLITLADKGMYLHVNKVPNESDDGPSSGLSPAFAQQIFDVCGAGDTVLAVVAIGLALNQNMFFFMELANLAAAQVCKQVGVTPVNLVKLLKETKKMME